MKSNLNLMRKLRNILGLGSQDSLIQIFETPKQFHVRLILIRQCLEKVIIPVTELVHWEREPVHAVPALCVQQGRQS